MEKNYLLIVAFDADGNYICQGLKDAYDNVTYKFFVVLKDDKKCMPLPFAEKKLLDEFGYRGQGEYVSKIAFHDGNMDNYFILRAMDCIKVKDIENINICRVSPEKMERLIEGDQIHQSVHVAAYFRSKTPNTIYHYTNFEALKGILFGRGIRLNDSQKMNDKDEIWYFIDGLEKAVIDKLKSQRQDDSVEPAKELFNEARNERKLEKVYLASFSELGDDAAQWERYADKAKGFAIGLDLRLLIKIKNNLSLPLCLDKVVYINDMKDHAHVVDACDLVSGYRGRLLTTHNFLNEKELFDNIWACACAYKNPTFESEKEFRIATLPGKENQWSKALGELDRQISSSGVKKFYNFDWKKQCTMCKVPINQLVREIVIGPMSRFEVDDIKKLLVENGMPELQDNVKKSRSSLIL
jgi:hypothetical protein